MHAIKTCRFCRNHRGEHTWRGLSDVRQHMCWLFRTRVHMCRAFGEDLTGAPGGSGAAAQLSPGIREDHWNHFWWWSCCGAGGYGGQTLPIWFQFGVDLISLSDGSNQGVSTVIPLQRRKKKKKKHDLEMMQGTNVEHTLQYTHQPLKQRGRQPSRVEYLCRSCHLLFKLWLCCSIFLHKWLIGLCSFFGFHSSLQDVNRQMNDYHQCARCTHTHTHNRPLFSKINWRISKGEKVLFNLSGQESFGL